MVDGLGHVDDPAPAAADAPQVEGVLEGGGLTVLREPGRERPVGPDEALVDGELDGLRLPGGVDPDGPALEAEVEGVGRLSTVLVNEGAAGQEDVVAGRVTASEDLILLDAGACARLTALLRRDLI